jgi:hypothetical protein
VALAGGGAVAIWHDITPEGREAFYAWHGVQHMPERVGIPGFLRGRRYVALDADLEYFNLYETASHAVVTGPDYLARLNAPTPWTQATVKHFRNVARSLCTVAATEGTGQGGLVATYRWSAPPGEAALRAALREAVPRIAGSAGVAGAHLLLADAQASGVDTAERRVRGSANAVPRVILMVEGWGDEAPFGAFARALVGDQACAAGGEAPVLGLYRLQNALEPRDLART